MKLKQTLKDKTLFRSKDNQLIKLSPRQFISLNILIDNLLDEDNCQLIFRDRKSTRLNSSH